MRRARRPTPVTLPAPYEPIALVAARWRAEIEGRQPRPDVVCSCASCAR